MALEVFDRKEQRLDTLFELCSWDHKKVIFVFCANCLLVSWQCRESLRAKRVVYDGVSAVGGVAKVDLASRMMQMVRGAYVQC